MTCIPAPAAKAVLAQATARWPGRSTASDGICPSAAHTAQNPTSDHERGMAVDLTHSPATGCDAHAWAEALRVARDPRVKYIISNGRIAASYAVAGYPAWAWRPYSGSNRHSSHVHVSLKDEARNDVSPWFGVTAASHQEDDDMTPDQAAQLKAVADEVARLAVAVRDPAVGLGKRLDDLVAEVRAIAAKVGA